MSTIIVSPNEIQPTHHISLSDGVNTIGLIAVKPDGTPDITAMRREPYPKSTLNSGGGEGALSTTKVPYGEVSRSEWYGGLGQLRADADRSKFLMGNSLWMANNRSIVAAPRLFKSNIDNPFGDAIIRPNGGGGETSYNPSQTQLIGWKFTPTQNGTFEQVSVELQMIPAESDGALSNGPGSQAAATLELWSSSANGLSPLALIDTSILSLVAVPETTTVFKFLTPQSVTAGTSYWFVLRGGKADGTLMAQKYALPVYTTNQDAAHKWAYSYDNGASWPIQNSGAMSWEIFQNRYQSGIFFEYKHALYCAVNPDATNGWLGPRLFLNGDRGVATVNPDKNKLIDTTKNWATNKYVGSIIRVIEGPAAGEWAQILSNNATVLTLDRNLTTPITTNSVYVITLTGEWQEISGHGMTNPIKHIAISNEGVIYFAFGAAANITRTQWVNSAGVWTNSGWVAESSAAALIYFTWDQEKKSVLWRAVNTGGKPYVARAVVPAWGTNLTWETEIYIGDDAPIRALLYNEGKLFIRKESSMWSVLEGVPDIVGLDMASRYSDERGINNMAVFSPYILFPYSGKLQRLLGTLAENLGPPTLPAEYQGEVVAVAPILGAVLVGLRTNIPVKKRGPHDVGGVSRVLLYKEGAWLPFCELPHGSELLNIFFQRQDNECDLLWIIANTGIYYIRVPREADYKIVESINRDLGFYPLQLSSACGLAVGQFDMGNKILNKWWERLNYADNGFKYVAYWTLPVLDIFSLGATEDKVSPFEDIYWLTGNTTNEFLIRKKSRRLGLFLFQAGQTDLFEYDGFNLSYLARVNDADLWIVPVNASDYDHDLNSIREEMTAAQKLAIIDAWSRDVVPITMRSVDIQDDNKRVILGRQPKQYRRYESSKAGKPGTAKEGFYTSLAIYEVT